MAVVEADVITAVNAFTYLSCQTAAEATAGMNTTANLLYASQSRNQGNFSLFYALAQAQATADQAAKGITLSDEYLKIAYVYLIGYYYETKFKDSLAKSVSQGSDSVTRDGSSFLKRYNELIASYKSGQSGGTTGGLTSTDLTMDRVNDYTNYPDTWRDLQIDPPAIDFDETSDEND